MSKFMPGPYSLPDEPAWFGFEARFYMICNSDDEIVAFVKDWHGNRQSKPTAKLIAAAPEMLAELTVLRDTIPHLDLPAAARVEMLRRINAVIAKATD